MESFKFQSLEQGNFIFLLYLLKLLPAAVQYYTPVDSPFCGPLTEQWESRFFDVR